jgi:hypothetical protein
MRRSGPTQAPDRIGRRDRVSVYDALGGVDGVGGKDTRLRPSFFATYTARSSDASSTRLYRRDAVVDEREHERDGELDQHDGDHEQHHDGDHHDPDASPTSRPHGSAPVQ